MQAIQQTAISPVAFVRPADEETVDATSRGALSDPKLRFAARALWKKAARERRLTPASVAAYHLLLGGKLDAAFAPITRPSKLSGGASAHGARDAALTAVAKLEASAFEPWRELLSEFYSAERWGRLPEAAKAHPLIAATR